MLKLLIVDDESYVIEDIRSSVDWYRLGIDAVWTASNMRQAKDIFGEQPIDLMLCDIEMPQGSGLELLAWVRENHPRVQSIFLTCHADFRYAKEAIRLGSLDYILKPFPYEVLEEAVAKAIAKINRDSELAENSRYGHFWQRNQPLLVERFWLDIINQTIPSSPTAIRKAADDRNIPFSEQIRIWPVLIQTQTWRQHLSLQDEKIMAFGLKNVAEEILAGEIRTGQFIELQRNCLLGVLTDGEGQGLDKRTLFDQCVDLIAKCNLYLACDLSCYIGEAVPAHELSALVERLLLQMKNNVAFSNRVFVLTETSSPVGSIQTKDMSAWAVLVTEGARDRLLSDVRQYLTDLSRTASLNANNLFQFQQYFAQMLYQSFLQKGIRIHELLTDSTFVDYQVKAPNSVRDMLGWIEYAFDKSQQYAQKIEQSESVIDKARKYIAGNLDRELMREEVASQVYLNPDYLDRIFKKETGVSVSRYIWQERLRIAEELLAKTDLPISTIAARIGYSNLSNFSSAYKKMTGKNPAEYRRSAGTGKIPG